MDPSGIADRMRRIQETITAAAVEAVSDDRAVTVTMGPGGAVRDLRFGPRAFQHSGAELGEIVVRTIREAHTLIDRELAATMADPAAGHPGPAPFGQPPTPARLRVQLDGEGGAAQ